MTIGVLTDLTGEAASGNKTSVQGVEAGIAAFGAASGYDIKYVVADTQTSLSSALQAARQLVEQDHVLAVLGASALTFAAAPYLTQQGIPVFGSSEDGGPGWVTSPNMFGIFGYVDTSFVTTTLGDFMKLVGATNIGALGYSISPASKRQAEASGISAQYAGLKAGYINANFPFGSTNVAPVALAMKSAGVDGFTAIVDANTAFALYDTLQQVGAKVKAALLPTGYGGDLLQAGPGALKAAQGAYFYTSYQPIEMHTPATEKLAAALKSVGVNGDPTQEEYATYVAMAQLVAALKGAGPNPTHASLIKAFGSIKGFNGAGLYGNDYIDYADRTPSFGVTKCDFVTKLSGSNFQLVPGADPICGTIIPGKKVS